MVETIPTNAIAEVTVNGLATDASGNAVPLIFRRGVPNPSRGFLKSGRKDIMRPEPKRPPSTLPPPGNARLTLTQSTKLSHGRCGCTSLVETDALTFPGPEATSAMENQELPPLCIKLALPGMSYRLSKEAWCYEEMEKLQGIAIPRCYGWFEAELEEGLVIEATEGVNSDDDSDDDSGDSDGDGDNNIDRYEDGYDDSDNSDTKSSSDEEFERPPRNPQKMRLRSSKIISILLLEELGERLLDVKEYPRSMRDDIYAVYEDICEMGIEHGDYRPQNVLRAAQCPPGFPSLRCPEHNCEHQWRIIDFHIARKTGCQPSILIYGPQSQLLNKFKV